MAKMKFTALVVVAGLWAMVPAGVQAVANCNTTVTATAPDSRYTDNGDGTVTDKRTGLMWKQCSEGQSTTTTACDTGAQTQFNWQGALQQAEALNSGGGFAGYSDWRLPNRNELASLVERQCFIPAINANLFPNTGASFYWSSSPYAYSLGRAWYVSFDFGFVMDSTQYNGLFARLVRGGQ